MPLLTTVAESSAKSYGRGVETQNYFAPDPYWANVVCLFTGEGTNGGTTITDVKNNTIVYGAPTTTTTRSRWGNGALNFTSAASSCIQFSNAAIQNNLIVVEAWMYSTALWSGQVLWDCRPVGTTTTGHVCYFSPVPIPGQIDVFEGTVHQYQSSIVPATNMWQHIAYVRSAATGGYRWRAYLNGTLATATSSIIHTPTLTSLGSICGFQGKASGTPTGAFTGYVNDFRITVGTDRGYTGNNILIPNAPMPRS